MRTEERKREILVGGGKEYRRALNIVCGTKLGVVKECSTNCPLFLIRLRPLLYTAQGNGNPERKESSLVNYSWTAAATCHWRLRHHGENILEFQYNFLVEYARF
jgi:hypothetical protein